MNKKVVHPWIKNDINVNSLCNNRLRRSSKTFLRKQENESHAAVLSYALISPDVTVLHDDVTFARTRATEVSQ